MPDTPINPLDAERFDGVLKGIARWLITPAAARRAARLRLARGHRGPGHPGDA
jgi:hypothetical protein